MNFSLQTLAITNFKAIKETLTLCFFNIPPGLYFVRGINELEPKLGSNGSSKSTIFVDALYWVLTGKVPRKSRPADDVVNWSKKGELTRVKLDLDIDGTYYVISRTRNPNALYLNTELVTQQQIDDLLPLTDSALRRSILIDQFGELFLSLGPEEKSRIFTETLDLNVWLDGAEKAGDEISSVEKAVVGLEKDLENIKGSLDVAITEFNTAVDKEERFETETKEQLKAKREAERSAEQAAALALQALNDARKRWNTVEKLGNDADRVSSLKTLLKQRQRVVTEYSSTLVREEQNYNQLAMKLEGYSGDKKVCPECGQVVADTHIRRKAEKIEKQKVESRRIYKETQKALQNAELVRDELEQEIEELEKGLIEWNKVQDAVALCAERSLSADKDLGKIRDEISDIAAKVNPYTEQCDRLDSKIKEYKSKIKQLKSEIAELNRKLEICKFWQTGFKEIRLEQIDACLFELELAANRHAEALGLNGWEMGFDTERETKKGSINRGFSVLLLPPGQTEYVSFESYSGGESQRLQLAATFGLAEVLLARSGISTDFECFDEPTIHLSPEGIDDLLSCLYDRAHDLNRRIFLIDHHSFQLGNFDGVISVKRTKNGVIVDDAGLGLIKQATIKKRVLL